MMCHTLEHIVLNDVEKMMREVHRVLKPGGQLLVICPDVMSLICLYTNVHSTGRDVKEHGESLYWDLSQEVWTGKTTNLPPGEQVSIESVLRHLVGSIVLEERKQVGHYGLDAIHMRGFSHKIVSEFTPVLGALSTSFTYC